MEVVETFLLGRRGDPELCEDASHLGADFVAVIDGATSKSERSWRGGASSGRVAAEIIDTTLGRLPSASTARQAVDALTAAVAQEYAAAGLTDTVAADPKQRICGSVAIFSRHRREVWTVGDCQALIGSALQRVRNPIDELMSSARAAAIELALAGGATVEQLRQDDVGRTFILPLLQRQQVLQNNPAAGPFWYSVIDGFPVPDDGIVVTPVPADCREVVLATDGYPILRGDLQSSEDALKELLTEDPLLHRRYRSTKAPVGPDGSFDDRCYVRLRLEAKA